MRPVYPVAFARTFPIAFAYFATAFVPEIDERLFALGWSLVGLSPLGYAVAILGYGCLDIDRVISASAAATVLGVALLGSLLAVVPPVAALASTTLGIDPETGRLALSMGLAAIVTKWRTLRPKAGDPWRRTRRGRCTRPPASPARQHRRRHAEGAVGKPHSWSVDRRWLHC
jgi:hypothetical protein